MTDGTAARHPRILATVGTYEILALTAAIWFFGKFIRYAFPPLFETLQGVYNVSTTEIGLAFSAFMALYALMQFPSGALADRFGSILVISGGALVAGFGSLALLGQPPFLALVVVMAIIGAGTGAHKTVAIRLLSNAYPSHFGRTLGVFDTIGAAGGVVAPLAVAAILALAIGDWRLLFAVTGIVFVAGALTFWIRMTDNDRVANDGQSTDQVLPWRSYAATFSRGKVLAFVGVTVLTAFAYNGVVAFLPLFLVAEANVTPAVASVLYSVLFLASAAQLVTGEAADRVGPLRTVTICLAGATAGIGALLVLMVAVEGNLTGIGGFLIGSAVVLLIGIGAHGYRPARDVYTVTLVPEATTGGALGVVRTILMGAAAVSPAVVGFIADQASFLIAFVMLAASMLGAFALAVLIALWERHTSP